HVHGRRAPAHRLRRLLARLRRAQVVVLVHDRHPRRLRLRLRLPHDGALALHQLPPQERRPHARQGHDVQVPQHLHRRPLCLYHQDAHPAPPRHVPRRRHLLRLHLPALGLHDRLLARQRVWPGRRRG
ncbi:hypothetical protein BN1708_019125, partial [Verticillium longisporum]